MSLICRTCSETKAKFVNIFNHYESNKLVSEMLNECTSVEIQKGDGLPLYICSECLEKLISAWCFRAMTLEIDLKLRKIFCKRVTVSKFQAKDCDTTIMKEETIVKDEVYNSQIVENESISVSDFSLNEVIEKDINSIEGSNETNLSDFTVSTCNDIEKQLPVPCINQDSNLGISSFNIQQHMEKDYIMEHDYVSKYNHDARNSNGKSNNFNKGLLEYKFNSFDYSLDINCEKDVENILPIETQFNENLEKQEEISVNYEEKDQESMTSNNEQPTIISQSSHITNSVNARKPNSYFIVQAIKENTPQETMTKHQNVLKMSSNENSTLFNNIGLYKVSPSDNDNNLDDIGSKMKNEQTKLVILGEYRKLTGEEKEKLSIRCKICKKTFKYRYYFHVHVRHHKGDLPYKCNVCGKGFAKRSFLKPHAVVHSEERPHSCDKCGKRFKMLNALQKHKTVHTDHKPHTCNTCHLSFKQESSLKSHLRRHQNQRDYICETCGKTFVESGDLRIHMKSHLSAKDYLCSSCGKAFSTNSKLGSHFKRSHTNERPYVCNHCGRCFKDKSTMENHALIHTGEKPHTCRLCSKSFRQSVALHTHMRTHTGEAPYICKLCPLRFKYSQLLTNHMKVHK